MKVLVVMLLFVAQGVLGQITDTIIVDYTKSAYLIFESDEVKYDCGSEDVYVKQAGNKLILQAGVERFEETNLFVEEGGKMFMFIVQYGNPNSKYIYNFANMRVIVPNDNGGSEEIGSYLENDSESEDKKLEEYKQVCQQIVDAPNQITNLGIVRYKLGMYLRDLVIHDDKMFFKFQVKNNGNIPYEVDYSKYIVKSVKKRIKGTSFQEIELNPIMVYKKPSRYEGSSDNVFIVVIDKFALTENKKMVVEQWEDNGVDMDIEGGRKIEFNIFSRDVLRVRSL